MIPLLAAEWCNSHFGLLAVSNGITLSHCNTDPPLASICLVAKCIKANPLMAKHWNDKPSFVGFPQNAWVGKIENSTHVGRDNFTIYATSNDYTNLNI